MKNLKQSTLELIYGYGGGVINRYLTDWLHKKKKKKESLSEFRLID